MKTIYFIILFSIIGSYSFAQTLNFNGLTLTLQPSTGVGGSKIYRYQQTSMTYYTLYRQSDDKWRFSYYSGFGGASGTYTTAITANPYATIDPPCNAVWNTRTSFSIPDSGNPIFDGVPSIFMVTVPPGSTSTCSPVLSFSGSSTSSYFAPPVLTTALILAIPTPPLGALVYDITAGCLKMFNGTSWVCL